MAGIITISPGHDASYPWRQIGTSAESGKTGQAGVGYYLSPSEKGGEPPGRWQGAGVTDLGFRQEQVIDRRCSSSCTASSSTPATRQDRPG
jgi:hypothetical protein